jgi:hypothetical protein
VLKCVLLACRQAGLPGETQACVALGDSPRNPSPFCVGKTVPSALRNLASFFGTSLKHWLRLYTRTYS